MSFKDDWRVSKTVLVDVPSLCLQRRVDFKDASSEEVAYRLSSIFVEGQVNLYTYTKGQVNLVSIERDA